MTAETRIERWGVFERTLEGPSTGNPFTEVDLTAEFRQADAVRTVRGFYEGEGLFRLRFMPDEEGTWTYRTRSNVAELDGVEGRFECVPPGPGNHGPVRVHATYHFAYADGTSHISVGTTCYAWAHQGDALEEQTLRTLATAPFNKLRMCVFPKHYAYNQNEPPLYPFEGTPLRGWDFSRFNPAFFRRFERKIERLMQMGIEADIILLHPYDRWGFAEMSPEKDDRYLRYVVARLAAYRNVWWSMANEFDFMRGKTDADWDRMFQVVASEDPYRHMLSVHNGARFYDHGKPWVTHCSVQSGAMESGRDWRRKYGKPVVFDEVCYEGDIEEPWGNITAEELTHRFWRGTVAGCYVGHGETYMHPEDVLWWSKGGVLYGKSAARIAFLRALLEELPHGLEPVEEPWHWRDRTARAGDGCYLFYFGPHQPSRWTLPDGGPWHAEIVDTWNMTRRLAGKDLPGGHKLAMPAKPWHALIVRRAAP